MVNWLNYLGLLILDMKKVLRARNFIAIHIAFQQRQLFLQIARSPLRVRWLCRGDRT
ncbi:hypothetical protein J5X98_03945 [Leptothermofonsia sichuanensis E412]|uniref:hypothetical protein n=1 Tax=Leptothermofonsia sichuanensis TaxID=2917832 RepID=UPI001CA691C2|nr:hypothetical protein [Leptothermofonsia sichuanensis]QZZ21623.1 hypothetical protein J5X98_03945 [Leptothermofonsia sichuanensis E412]